MRYVIVLIAYAFVAFLLGLAFLFPNRPTDMSDLLLIVVILIPILALFDLIGQNIIDNDKLAAMGPGAKPAAGVVAFILFIAAVYLVVKKIAPPTVPWF